MGSLRIIVDKVNGGVFVKNGVPQITGTPLLLGGNASASIVRQNLAMLAAIEPFAKAVDGFTKQTIGEPVVPHTHIHTYILTGNNAWTLLALGGNGPCHASLSNMDFRAGAMDRAGLTFGNMLGLPSASKCAQSTRKLPPRPCNATPPHDQAVHPPHT